MIEEEEWLSVKGFDHYLISNWGRVYNTRTDALLNPRLSDWGYLQVCLSDGSRKSWRYVHRLVAESYIPGEDVGLEVNHIDGDKTYNNEINLEWVTKSMNNQHAIDTGLRTPRGVSCRIVNTGEVFRSISDLAKRVGMTPVGVKYALRYGTKTRNGLKFEYVD